MAAPAAESVAVTGLRAVLHRVQRAAEQASRRAEDVRVVAVGKTKSVSLINQVYDGGHRCFGENYVQEIIEKAPQLPDDIDWHFIGHLQSNKVKPLLAAVPNLGVVEGVDNQKVANYLDREVSRIGRPPLKVFVQVNTSGEPSKSGVDPSDCVDLVNLVKLGCPNLEFSGLMTIGMPVYSSTPENFKNMELKSSLCHCHNSIYPLRAFAGMRGGVWGETEDPLQSLLNTLLNCRTEVCKVLGMAEIQCELSMGMSNGFEQAIKMGSTNVRIGSTIFGPREYPKRQ